MEVNLTNNHMIGTVQDKQVNGSRREREPTNRTTTEETNTSRETDVISTKYD